MVDLAIKVVAIAVMAVVFLGAIVSAYDVRETADLRKAVGSFLGATVLWVAAVAVGAAAVVFLAR